MIEQKPVLSLSTQLIIPEEKEYGQERKEGVCAKHRRLLKKRVQSGRPDSRLQINDDMSFSSFSLYPSCAFAKHSRRRVVEKKEVLRGKGEKQNRDAPATQR